MFVHSNLLTYLTFCDPNRLPLSFNERPDLFALSLQFLLSRLRLFSLIQIQRNPSSPLTSTKNTTLSMKHQIPEDFHFSLLWCPIEWSSLGLQVSCSLLVSWLHWDFVLQPYKGHNQMIITTLLMVFDPMNFVLF